MELEEYLLWFDVTDELFIESYEVDEWDHVVSITFPWGETLGPF